VNKGRIPPNYRLKDGDIIRIPPIRQSQPNDVSQLKIPGYIQKQLGEATLFENDDVLVLDKPSGLAVHAGSGLVFGLIEAIRQLRPDAGFLELVHRLDRETSGCLILARNRASLLALHDQFRESGIKKKYLALLAGAWNCGDKTVSAPLLKNTLKGGERIVQVSKQGKPSVSHFHPVNIFPDASLMEVQLETGRTHQIRVHALHIEHPIIGDSKYGDTEVNRKFKKKGLKRLFLHAHSVEFTLPGMPDGDTVLVSAPLPVELKMVLDKLEGRS